MVPIPVMEYRQMAGRAGRPGLDPRGEALLMAKNEAEVRDLLDHYVLGEPEEIFSKLAMEPALRTHLLSTVATGFAKDEEELKRFVDSTFYASQQEAWHLEATMERVLEFLNRGRHVGGGPAAHPPGGARFAAVHRVLLREDIVENLPAISG